MNAIAKISAIALCLTSIHLLHAQEIEASVDDALVSSYIQEETISEADFNVYPNPANEVLQLHSKEELEMVTVVNEQGVKIMQLRASEFYRNRMDISKLPEGFYKVSLYSKNASKDFTIIKI